MKTPEGLRLLPDTTAAPVRTVHTKRMSGPKKAALAVGLLTAASVGVSVNNAVQENNAIDAQPVCAVPLTAERPTASAAMAAADGNGNIQIWGYDGKKPVMRVDAFHAQKGDEAVLEHAPADMCVAIGGHVLTSMQNAPQELAPILSRDNR